MTQYSCVLFFFIGLVLRFFFLRLGCPQQLATEGSGAHQIDMCGSGHLGCGSTLPPTLSLLLPRENAIVCYLGFILSQWSSAVGNRGKRSSPDRYMWQWSPGLWIHTATDPFSVASPRECHWSTIVCCLGLRVPNSNNPQGRCCWAN